MSDDKISSGNEDNFRSDSEVTSNDVWPRKLNKLIIGVGVIAFGLIIADRLLNAFQENDAPAAVAIERNDDISPVALGELNEQGDIIVDVAPVVKEALNLETVFGGRLVFVSASEPLYVLTDEDKRFDVGGSIDDETTLAGITGQRVILERQGELLVLNLPEPSAE